MPRYIRNPQANAIAKTRKMALEANKPTGTEKSRTREVAAQAGLDADFAKQLAQQLEVELGPLPGQIQEALDDAAAALSEAGLARSEAVSAVSAAQDAVADAATAISEAQAAAQAAADAQTAADGKSTVVRSTSPATGAGSYSEGDQWWQFSGANIVGLWLHDGAAWVSQALTNAIIATLDAGKITTGTLAADRIGALSITAAKIAAQAITTEKIAALAVTASELAANSVVATKIAANAVVAEKISAGAVTTIKLDALAVTAEKIAAGAIIADKIAAGAITTAKLAADAIDGMTITGALIQGGVVRQQDVYNQNETTRLILPRNLPSWVMAAPPTGGASQVARSRLVSLSTTDPWYGPITAPPSGVLSSSFELGPRWLVSGTFINRSRIRIPSKFAVGRSITTTVWMYSAKIAKTVTIRWPDNTTQNVSIAADTWQSATKTGLRVNDFVDVENSLNYYPNSSNLLGVADVIFQSSQGALGRGELAATDEGPSLTFYSGATEGTLAEIGSVSPSGVRLDGVELNESGLLVPDGGAVASGGDLTVVGRNVQIMASDSITIGTPGAAEPVLIAGNVSYYGDTGWQLIDETVDGVRFGTLGPSFAHDTNPYYGGLWARIKNNVFYVTGRILRASFAGNAVLFSLVAAYRPSKPVVQYAYAGNANFAVAEPGGNTIIALAGTGGVTLGFSWPLD